MIRTIITPKNTDVHFTIPAEYVGEKLELILFATKETKKVKPKKTATLVDFKGMLTPEDADLFNAEIKKSRGEWGNIF